MYYSEKDRPEVLGEYLVEHRATVRAAAKQFGISKSTVHKDLTERLPRVNKALYANVRKVLDKNKAERHIRGGMATSSNLFIMQMQDILGLGKAARINTPGTLGENWRWRMKAGAAAPEIALKLYEKTKLFGRLP